MTRFLILNLMLDLSAWLRVLAHWLNVSSAWILGRARRLNEYVEKSIGELESQGK